MISKSHQQVEDEPQAKEEVPKRPNAKEITSDTYLPYTSTDVAPFLDQLRADYPALAHLLDLQGIPAQIEYLSTLSLKEQQRIFVILLTLAHSFRKQGRYRDALTLNHLRLEIAKLQPQDALTSLLGRSAARNCGDTLSAIGDTLTDAGELGRALAAHLEAEAHFERDAIARAQAGATSPLEIDRVFHQADFRSENFAAISSLYGRLNQPERRAEYDALAWQHSKRGKEAEDKFEELMSHATAQEDRGDADAALGIYWKAAELAFSLKSSQVTGQVVVRVLRSIANIHQQLGLYRRALELYERCLAINERNEHSGRQQEDLSKIAEVYTAKGDASRAMASYQRSLALCCAPILEADQTPLVWEVDGRRLRIVRLEPAARVLLAMARLLRATDPKTAENHLRVAMDLVEHIRGRVFLDDSRVSYQETGTDIFDELIDLTYESYVREGSDALLGQLFELFERAKSRVLSEMVADQPLAPAGVPPELLAEEAALLAKEKELEGQVESRAATMEFAGELDSVRRRLDANWDAMERHPAGAKYVAIRRARPIAPSELRMLLTDRGKVAVVNYFATRRHLIALVMYTESDRLAVAAVKHGREELRALAMVEEGNLMALDLRLPYWELDFPSVAIEPVRSLLSAAEHVVLIPHDVLHSIPLHALAANGSKPLIAEYSVSFAPSASVLRFCLGRPPCSASLALVLGGPARSDHPPLPHAIEEATSVAAVLQSKAHVGASATCAVVLNEADKARYIHLACHNHFDAHDPLASSLRLSDGDLTARALFGLKIEPELVVLSACQSGLSSRHPGDELIGIVRALLFAGARSIVVSLWNAFDASTADLMVDFYRRFHDGAQATGVALCEAQRTLRRSGRRTSEWAPFVLIGDWNRLDRVEQNRGTE